MCKICHLSVCDEACPDFSGHIAGVGKPVARCFICDNDLYASQPLFEISDVTLCNACIGEMSLDDFADLLCCDIKDIVENLGGFSRQE